MKTKKKATRNLVAKYMNKFNRPVIERDRTKYHRAVKHKNKRAYQDVLTYLLLSPFRVVFQQPLLSALKP